MVLTQWQLWMQAQGLSERTITERLGTVRNMLSHACIMPLALSPEHIQEYLSRPMSPATRATYHASVRAFCAWMQRAGVRPDNPADLTPRPRRPKSRPRPVEDAQLVAMLEAANRRRTRTYILLGALAGLRVHEIAKVHGADIDPYTQVLTVIGKGGKVGQIPLHEILVEEAGRYPRDGYWFPAYEKQTDAAHVGPHAVSAAISGAMRRAGIVAVPHQLRHYYGTALVRAGVHMRIVQELMRHATPASTAIYTDVDFTQMRDGIAMLGVPRERIAA